MLSYCIAKTKKQPKNKCKKGWSRESVKRKGYSILPAEDIQYKYLMNNNVDRR